MIQNEFSKSIAKKIGGAVFYNLYSPVDLLNNTFSENAALYGPDYGSYPFKLKILNADLEWTQGFVSG